MSFVTDLKVASLLVYPKGKSAASNEARRFIRYDIKQARAGKIRKTVKKVLEEPAKKLLEEFFNEPFSLVPMPGHTPRLKNSLWVPEIICREMFKSGFGQEILPCLSRSTAVKRSSSSTQAEDRPTAIEHFETMDVDSVMASTGRLVLVDDVVTRGATLIGAATRLKERFPNIDIFAFALARVSATDIETTADMLDPWIENIHFEAANPLGINRRRV